MRRDFPALARAHAPRADAIVVSSRYAAGDVVARRSACRRSRIHRLPAGAPRWAEAPCSAAAAPCAAHPLPRHARAAQEPGLLLDAYAQLTRAAPGRAAAGHRRARMTRSRSTRGRKQAARATPGGPRSSGRLRGRAHAAGAVRRRAHARAAVARRGLRSARARSHGVRRAGRGLDRRLAAGSGRRRGAARSRRTTWTGLRDAMDALLHADVAAAAAGARPGPRRRVPMGPACAAARRWPPTGGAGAPGVNVRGRRARAVRQADGRRPLSGGAAGRVVRRAGGAAPRLGALRPIGRRRRPPVSPAASPVRRAPAARRGSSGRWRARWSPTGPTCSSRPGYTAPLTAPCPLVVAIHDVSFAARPEWFPAARAPPAGRHARGAPGARDGADHLARSRSARSWRDLGVPADRIRVMPLGVRAGGWPASGPAERTDGAVRRFHFRAPPRRRARRRLLTSRRPRCPGASSISSARTAAIRGVDPRSGPLARVGAGARPGAPALVRGRGDAQDALRPRPVRSRSCRIRGLRPHAAGGDGARRAAGGPRHAESHAKLYGAAARYVALGPALDAALAAALDRAARRRRRHGAMLAAGPGGAVALRLGADGGRDAGRAGGGRVPADSPRWRRDRDATTPGPRSATAWSPSSGAPAPLPPTIVVVDNASTDGTAATGPAAVSGGAGGRDRRQPRLRARQQHRHPREPQRTACCCSTRTRSCPRGRSSAAARAGLDPDAAVAGPRLVDGAGPRRAVVRPADQSVGASCSRNSCCRLYNRKCRLAVRYVERLSRSPASGPGSAAPAY